MRGVDLEQDCHAIYKNNQSILERAVHVKPHQKRRFSCLFCPRIQEKGELEATKVGRELSLAAGEL
jgi:hypothetical protein